MTQRSAFPVFKVREEARRWQALRLSDQGPPAPFPIFAASIVGVTGDPGARILTLPPRTAPPARPIPSSVLLCAPSYVGHVRERQKERRVAAILSVRCTEQDLRHPELPKCWCVGAKTTKCGGLALFWLFLSCQHAHSFPGVRRRCPRLVGPAVLTSCQCAAKLPVYIGLALF